MGHSLCSMQDEPEMGLEEMEPGGWHVSGLQGGRALGRRVAVSAELQPNQTTLHPAEPCHALSNLMHVLCCNKVPHVPPEGSRVVVAGDVSLSGSIQQHCCPRH